MLHNFLQNTYLDEIGLRFGLVRFTKETLKEYRTRLFKHISDLPESTQKSFLATMGRYVAELDKQLFRIEPVLEWNDITAIYEYKAPNLHIEVDSCFFRVWSDYLNKKDEPEVEIDIWNRGTGYFLKDVYNAIKDLDFITVTTLKKSWQYWKSSHLRYENISMFISGWNLTGGKMQQLPNKHIKEISFTNTTSFLKEVFAHEDISDPGDYFIDYVEGIIFSDSNGRGQCDYSYCDFPYYIYWQPVRSIPINDKSLDHMIKDWLINTEYIPERLLLNDYGAKIANEILQIFPLQWGK